MRLALVAAVLCLTLNARADDDDVSVQIGPTGVRVKTKKTEVRTDSGSVEVDGARGRVKAANVVVDTAGGTTSDGDALEIDGAGRSHDGDCGGRDVRISGTGNKVKLTGECGHVTVEGTRNTVAVDTVAAISVSGVSNAVTWKRAAGGEKKPRVSTDGLKNVVAQGK